MSSSIHPSTIAAISVGTVVTGLVGYAVYFDHRRRTDPEFRKAIRRDIKKQAKAQKAAQEASAADLRKTVAQRVRDINAQGFPSDPEDREGHFLESMQSAESHIAAHEHVEAATDLFKCLKVYPAKAELIRMFDQTVPKDVLDILAIMIANDPSISHDDIDVA